MNKLFMAIIIATQIITSAGDNISSILYNKLAFSWNKWSYLQDNSDFVLWGIEGSTLYLHMGNTSYDSIKQFSYSEPMFKDLSIPWKKYLNCITEIIYSEKSDDLIAMRSAFANSGLTSFSANRKNVYLEPYSFSNCVELDSVSICAENINLEEGCFCGCTNLKNVVFLNNSPLGIGISAFANCSSLEEIDLAKGDINMDAEAIICESAFSDCTSLTKIYIPNNISIIDYGAFYNCDALSDVYYSGTMSEWNRITICDGGNDPLTNATIHCSDGDISFGAKDTQEESAEIIDVLDYLENYTDLIDELNMTHVTPWQFGDINNSFSSNGFYLEFYETMFSMKNEGSNNVVIGGISLSDDMDTIHKNMTINGWNMLFDHDTYRFYYYKNGDDVYVIVFYMNKDGSIDYWYMNNWPEGEDFSDLY